MPKRGRASKACDRCRKQKTRCFPAEGACLRCKTLGLTCSFGVEGEPLGFDLGTGAGYNGLGYGRGHGQRLGAHHGSHSVGELDIGSPAGSASLQSIQGGINEILKTLRVHRDTGVNRLQLPKSEDFSDVSELKKVEPPSFGQSSVSFCASPYRLFGSLVAPPLLPLPIGRLFNPQMVVHDQNVITLGIISRSEAIELLEYFRMHFNHWLSFPSNLETSDLVDRITQRCSLLLSACCCVALRYRNEPETILLKGRCYRPLVRRLLTEMNQSLMVVPQTLEFMQAVALLAIFGSSLSDGDIVFDGWFLSSIALEHLVTKDVLGLAMPFDGDQGPVTDFDELTAYRIWNHLCLAHLVDCVMSGRTCILDEYRLARCRRTLELPQSSNFDGRMIAEILLLYIVYTFVQSAQSQDNALADLNQWHSDWSHLFGQPAIQFTQCGYHFGYFYILYFSVYLGRLIEQGPRQPLEDAVDPIDPLSLCGNDLREQMSHHLLVVVNSMVSFDDIEHFAHLSDQIHFQGAFASVILLRLIAIEGRYHALSIDPASAESTNQSKSNHAALEKVGLLGQRFQQISSHENDLPRKYAQAIADAMMGI